jgi:hypothetical protein
MPPDVESASWQFKCLKRRQWFTKFGLTTPAELKIIGTSGLQRHERMVNSLI